MNIKFNKKIVYTLVVIIIPIIMILFIKFSTKSKNISTLENLLNKVYECNVTLKNATLNRTIDIDSSKELLTSGLITLSNLNEDLKKVEKNTKNEDLILKTSEVLNSNIALYEVTLETLKSPSNDNLTIKYNNFLNNYNLLNSNYKTLDILGVNAKFPPEAKEFFDNFNIYISSLIKITGENEILKEKNLQYSTSLEKCITFFDEIDEDLEPALNKIKEDGRNLEVLLIDIKSKKSTLNEIKNISYSISIPNEGNHCYELLKDTINYFDLYITSLEHSIIIEKTCDSSPDKDNNILENYKNSFAKYNDFLDNYASFKKEVEEFKKNCI